MPVTLNPVTGDLDADIVDGNFQELENFLREGVKKEDFSNAESDKFNKYSIRRHTSGKIAAFDTGARRIPLAKMAGVVGTFENNWMSGTPETTFYRTNDDSIQHIVENAFFWKSYPEDSAYPSGLASTADWENYYGRKKDQSDNTDPLSHPYELLGFPGGSLHFDFQEQGFPEPVTYFAAKGRSETVVDWPPEKGPQRFPDEECWSRWLTIPHAAGGVYVDEPCVAVISAQVTGNYFFTPAMKVHGLNAQVVPGSFDIGLGSNAVFLSLTDPPVPSFVSPWRDGGAGHITPEIGTEKFFIKKGGRITEGMQYSASIRLGLFVDTNPVVWADEFPNEGRNVDGRNPWIGNKPTGKYATSGRVAKTRSWKKVTDLSLRVRQRNTYKVVGAVQLKGRRRYNFSLKYRPAMTFGHISPESYGAGKIRFKPGYHELNEKAFRLKNSGDFNHSWDWESADGKTIEDSYFYPGGDILATNLIESSALSVEFFYGAQLDTDLFEFIDKNENVKIDTPKLAGEN